VTGSWGLGLAWVVLVLLLRLAEVQRWPSEQEWGPPWELLSGQGLRWR